MNSIRPSGTRDPRVKAVEPGNHQNIRDDEQDFVKELKRQEEKHDSSKDEDEDDLPQDRIELDSEVIPDDVPAEESESTKSKLEPDEEGHVDLRI
jgi:hypothetical protein